MVGVSVLSVAKYISLLRRTSICVDVASHSPAPFPRLVSDEEDIIDFDFMLHYLPFKPMS